MHLDSQPLSFSYKVRAICLPPADFNPENLIATVIAGA